MRWMAVAAAAALVTAPAAAQQHDGHGAAAAGAAEGAGHMMMCSVGGMSGGMQHGAGAAQGGAAQGGMQHGQGSGGMQHGQGGGGMHAGMMPWSHEFMALTHHASEFGLSEAQQERIAALRQEAQTSCERHMTQAMSAHEAANAAWQKDTPDVAAWQSSLREAATHMAEAQLAVGRAAIAALEVLTPEQRAKAAAERKGHAGGGDH